MPKSRRTCGSRSTTTLSSARPTESSCESTPRRTSLTLLTSTPGLAICLPTCSAARRQYRCWNERCRVRGDQPRALATLGILRIRQGDRREGLSLLERAAAAGPDIESVQFEYGWALATEDVFDAARAQRARAAFERALALRPGYPAAIQMLASVYGRTGDFAKMRDLLAPLVKAAPDNQDAALQLAAALLGLGDIAAARALVGPILARPRPMTTPGSARERCSVSSRSCNRNADSDCRPLQPSFQRLRNHARRAIDTTGGAVERFRATVLLTFAGSAGPAALPRTEHRSRSSVKSG